MNRHLKKKIKELQLAEHRVIHDEPTRWDSAFEMGQMFYRYINKLGSGLV